MATHVWAAPPGKKGEGTESVTCLVFELIFLFHLSLCFHFTYDLLLQQMPPMEQEIDPVLSFPC